MSTEKSLEDRAREFYMFPPGSDDESRLLTLLRQVNTSATERATEAARGEVERRTRELEELRVELRSAEAAHVAHHEHENAEITRLLGEVKLLHQRVADQRASLDASETIIARKTGRIAALSERLAVGERLVRAALEEGNACACLDKGKPDEYTCWSCEARAFLATPAAPVTPAESPCGSCPHAPHLGMCTKRNGGTANPCPCLKDTLPAPAEPTDHELEARAQAGEFDHDGADCEGEFVAVTPKGEPRADQQISKAERREGTAEGPASTTRVRESAPSAAPGPAQNSARAASGASRHPAAPSEPQSEAPPGLVCSNCGPVGVVDEDGCCEECGSETVLSAAPPAPAADAAKCAKCSGPGSMVLCEDCFRRVRSASAAPTDEPPRCPSCKGDGFFDAVVGVNEHTTRECRACGGTGDAPPTPPPGSSPGSEAPPAVCGFVGDGLIETACTEPPGHPRGPMPGDMGHRWSATHPRGHEMLRLVRGDCIDAYGACHHCYERKHARERDDRDAAVSRACARWAAAEELLTDFARHAQLTPSQRCTYCRAQVHTAWCPARLSAIFLGPPVTSDDGKLTVGHLAETCSHGIPVRTCYDHRDPTATTETPTATGGDRG